MWLSISISLSSFLSLFLSFYVSAHFYSAITLVRLSLHVAFSLSVSLSFPTFCEDDIPRSSSNLTLSSVYNGIKGWIFTRYGIFLSLLIGQKFVTRTNRRTVWRHVTWKKKTTSPVTLPLKVSGEVIFIKLWVTWLHTVLSLVDQAVKLPAFCPSYGVKKNPGWSPEPYNTQN